MPGGSLFWRIYRICLLTIGLGAAAFAWITTTSFRNANLDRATADISAQVILLQGILSERPFPSDSLTLDSIVRSLAGRLNAPVSILLPPGRVVADSRAQTSLIHDQANRPEIIAALGGHTGVASRYSNSASTNILYAAAPLFRGGKLAAVVRIEMSLQPLEDALEALRRWLLGGTAALLLLAAILSWSLARHILRPLRLLRAEAERIAAGDAVALIASGGGPELSRLAEAMNQMAAQLYDRIQTVTRQRNEQEAILASMAEGVLAVDSYENLINVNQAAVRLIGLSPDMVQGRPILEVIRNAELQALVTRTLQSQALVEGDVVLTDNGEQFLQVHGVPLRDARGQALGALVVLNDVTRLRRLENIRRDFVANVSHELKTPITSIKGFVETLQDGAVRSNEETQRFLGIIAKHSDRLNSIIEDLLTLSRIEQEFERAEILLTDGSVRSVLESAIHACEAKVAEKQMVVKLNCDNGVRARMNAPLLEQAVVNLIDNAVKYSDPGKSVQVDAEVTAGEVTISVRDSGCGIAHEHLSRIFERFYRVDKARSRTLGGTGLGLAIVKHIVLAHRGTVTVESTVGQSSTFCVHLPL